jgi:hypothetical protein
MPASQRWRPVTAAEIVARAGRGPFAARQAAGAFGPLPTLESCAANVISEPNLTDVVVYINCCFS